MRRASLLVVLILGLTLGSFSAWAWPPPPGSSGDNCKSVSQSHNANGEQIAETWSCDGYYISCNTGPNNDLWWPQNCEKRPKAES